MYSKSSTKFVFLGPILQQRWQTWPLIGWLIFYFSATAKRNSTKFDGKQIRVLNALYMYKVWFQADPSIKSPSLIGWDIFNFSFAAAERNLKKLGRKQVLNILYKVCEGFFFRDDPSTKMATLAPDWLRRFQLLACNHSVRNLTKYNRKQVLNVASF